MTRNDINVALCAVITTAAEVKEPAPLSILYLGLQQAAGLSLDDFCGLTGIMAQAGLAEITSETLTLTAAGRDMAVKIEAHAGKRS